MRSFILSFFALVVIAFASPSCGYGVTKQLTGSWEMFLIPSPGFREVWTFTENEIEVVRYNNDTVPYPLKKGTYTVKNNTITTSGPGMVSKGGEYYLGNFQIKSLTGSELVLVRTDLGLQYYEFAKK